MKQGEIWNANLNPAKGSEFRPVAIISGNLLNQYLPVVIVVPLTAKIKNYHGNPILNPGKANGLKRPSEMLVFHIRSISKDRLVEKLGNIKSEELNQAVKTLQDILKF